MVTLPALELEGDLFRRPELIHDSGGDRGTLDNRSPYRGSGPVIEEENLAELDLLVDFGVELLYLQLVSFLDAILLSAGFEYCVGHGAGVKRNKLQPGASSAAGREFTTGAWPEQEIFAKRARHPQSARE